VSCVVLLVVGECIVDDEMNINLTTQNIPGALQQWLMLIQGGSSSNSDIREEKNRYAVPLIYVKRKDLLAGRCVINVITLVTKTRLHSTCTVPGSEKESF